MQYRPKATHLCLSINEARVPRSIHRPVPGGRPVGRRPAFPAAECVSKNMDGMGERRHGKLATVTCDNRRSNRTMDAMTDASLLYRWEIGIRTASGVSVGWTRVPSKRNRTELRDLPWRSQKAVINFSSLVVLLILKKTSLLLSETLMLRCSALAGASGAPPAGLPFSFSADILFSCIEGILGNEESCQV